MLFQRFISTTIIASVIVLCTLDLSAADPAEQQLLAVFDLTSDGSVSGKNLKSISDKISILIDSEKTYTQFNREMMPDLFNQLALDQAAIVCSDMQCLILLGNIIGATVVLGGYISTTGRQTIIELNLVDVPEKRKINTISFTSVAKKNDFIEKELPVLVKDLLSSHTPSPIASRPSIKRRSIFANPLLYTGTLLVGGAAAAAYYFLVYKNSDDHEAVNQPVNEPLSLDDIPIPTRGTR